MTYGSKVHSTAVVIGKMIMQLDQPGAASVQKRAFNILYCTTGGSTKLNSETYQEVENYASFLTGLVSKDERFEYLESLYNQLKACLSPNQQAKFEESFKKSKGNKNMDAIRDTIKKELNKIN